MLDLNSFANTVVKTVASPPPQAQPAVAEETKAVPNTETSQAVPPPAAGKGGNEPGLGEHLDVYDNEGKPHAEKTPRQKVEEARSEAKARLLGYGTGLPQPTVDPPPPELPFLKPLGHPLLGSAIDATI